MLKQMAIEKLVFIQNQFEEFCQGDGGKLVRIALQQAEKREREGLGYSTSTAGEPARIQAIEHNARAGLLLGLQAEGFGLLGMVAEELRRRSGEKQT